MKKHLYTFVFFFCVAIATAQSLRKAELYYRDFAYTDAAKEYEEYLAKKENPDAIILLHAAEANYHIGNTAAAITLYKKAFSLEGDTIQEAHLFHYIRSLRYEKQYSLATELELQWLNSGKGSKAARENFASQKKHLDSISGLPLKIKLKNLAINTDKADFGVAFYGKKAVYASARDTVRDGGKTYSWNAQPYLSLFVADRNEDGTFGKEKVFLQNAQTDYHNAAAAFSPDFKRVYVSVNNVDKTGRLQNSGKGTNNIQLVYGEINGERLYNKQLAAFNSKDYSVGQPAVSPDGKRLYFVSDMPGGYGETDIYYCEIYKDGKLGSPVNAGAIINTRGREMFPFVKQDTLYFASDGHYGLGGLDVFYSIMHSRNKFALPKNMGAPVNSNRDDFAWVQDGNGKYTYITSNRLGGMGDDDIYLIVPHDTPVPDEGVVPDIPIAETEEAVPPLSDFTKKRSDGDEMIDINPIYFDFDKYYITPQGALELDKVVYVMEKFPGVIIKIESHTDSRGTNEYNRELSNNRAKSTYDYLLSKGINPVRIESVTGYGESRLVNECADSVLCNEKEHQENRRSDFIIVKK